MAQTDPLAQLKDIHLPEPVGLWPLAWGWWLLLAFVLAVVAGSIFLWRRHQMRNRYRALARAELQRAKLVFDQDRDTASYLQNVSIVLRRAAMSGGGDSYHPNLTGEAWLQWLDDQCPATSNGFTVGPGRVLLIGPYQKAPEADVESLHLLALKWLEQHRNQWQKKSSGLTKTSSVKNQSAQMPAAKKSAEQEIHDVSSAHSARENAPTAEVKTDA